MSATEFSADLRDIRFVLNEQLDFLGALGGSELFGEIDAEMADSILDEGYRVATDVIAPLNTNSDREGCSFDGKGNVTTPKGFKEAWKVAAEGGWIGMAGPAELGGMGMPLVLESAVGETQTGACMSFALYPGLTRGAANLLVEYAPEAHKQLVCEKLFMGEWAGTMCLTEAGAGSDVGASRAKAVPTDKPGVYELTGEKMFISSGDHDLAENILHLVLARNPESPDGTRGLSIFLVPKFHYAEDGTLGARNGIYVNGIEEKMGIHGSATCTLVMGADEKCTGYLLGEENKGMSIMFHMMNEARIAVGVQGLAGGAAAYQNALAYAKDRVQGSSIEQFGEAGAAKVTIDMHPDVRRMLLWMKVHVEAMRSLVYSTALAADLERVTEDKDQRREYKGYVELMTPIVKSICSDRGFDVTVQAVQVFGGYGYIGEYPVEQHLRDAKISSIYEGTNGIQAMDLLGRKMSKGSGILFMNWLNRCNAEIEKARVHEDLADVIVAMEKARDSLGGSAMHLGGLGMQGNMKGAIVHATPFQDQFGTVVLGLHTLMQARVASEKLAAGAEGANANFYKGKVLGAKFYAHNVLPRAVSLGKGIRSGDESCMDAALFSD